MLSLVIVPPAWLLIIIFILTLNAAGATGDMAIAGWLLTTPPNSYAQDRGDAFSLYVTDQTSNAPE